MPLSTFQTGEKTTRALDINGYNATFKAFTDFATQSVEAGKSKAVARAGGEGALADRVITAAKHDWVGIGAGRLGSLKDANNAARDLFRNAIADMFGGPDKIPQSVQDAIKDTRNFKNQPAEVKDRVASLLVETAKSDRDLLALMRMNRGFVTYGLVLNAAGQVRSDDKILQRLEALRDNVNELRAATRGDGRLFEMGLKQLAMLEGNALKPGVISRMFETVANEDVGELRNLSGKSSPSS